MNSNKKNLSALLLLTLMVSSLQTKNDNSLYPLIHKWTVLSRHLGLVLGPAITAKNFISYKNQLPSLPHAPTIVVQFCKEKLKSQGLNADEINIVVKEDCSFLEAFGKNHIIIDPLSADEFQKALENPTEEASINIIGIYSTFLDHEIAHLKNNDANKRLPVLIGATLASYALSSYVINSSRLKPFFQEPTNIKEFCRTHVAYNLMSLGCSVLTKSLYGWYARYQENRADAYAISQAKDPEALRYAAKYLEMADNGMIDVLCGSPINPNLPFATQFAMQYVRGLLTAQYQTRKPTVDFRSWVTQQSKALAVLKFLHDVEHPSGFSRGQIMRKAADALDAIKNASSSTLSQPAAAPAA